MAARTLKLHWSPRSPFVRKVMVCAEELGLAGELERVRTVVEMTRPNHALLPHNPLGKIPTLETGDAAVGTLFDSAVICEYLDTLAGGSRLFPVDLAHRFQALRWQALGDGLLELSVLWRNERRRPPAQQSAELLAAFELKGRTTLDAIDAEAAALARAPFTIGPVTIACALGYLDFRFAELPWRTGRPHAAAWYEDVLRRPSMLKTVPVDDAG